MPSQASGPCRRGSIPFPGHAVRRAGKRGSPIREQPADPPAAAAAQIRQRWGRLAATSPPARSPFAKPPTPSDSQSPLSGSRSHFRRRWREQRPQAANPGVQQVRVKRLRWQPGGQTADHPHLQHRMLGENCRQFGRSRNRRLQVGCLPHRRAVFPFCPSPRHWPPPCRRRRQLLQLGFQRRRRRDPFAETAFSNCPAAPAPGDSPSWLSDCFARSSVTRS